MSNNFIYNTPTKVYFGKGTVDSAGSLVKERGYKKVLLHYGGGSAVKSGLIGRVEKSLKDSGIEYVSLGGVVPNPRLSLAIEGRDLCRKEGVDFILAVGGGSVIDSAKAIAYTVCYDGDPWDLWGKKHVVNETLPLGCILTIAAAGSEMSNSCVITKDDEKKKRGYSNDICRPKFAIMDPELTVTLPDYQSMAGATDIIMHTLERYFTAKGNMDITDRIAEGLVKTVMDNASIVHKDPENIDARAEIMWAGSLSHNGLTGCGNGGDDFVTHGIEHELSGMFDVTHGAGLAAVWGSWARYVSKAIPERFISFGKNVFGHENTGNQEEMVEKCISSMEGFFKSIGMPVSIKEMGIDVTEDQINEMARLYADGCGGCKGAAMPIREEDARKIYKMAAK